MLCPAMLLARLTTYLFLLIVWLFMVTCSAVKAATHDVRDSCEEDFPTMKRDLKGIFRGKAFL